MLQILVIVRVFSYINYIERGNFFDLYKQNHLKRTMTTEYLKFPRTYADLERNDFENAPYIHAVWRLTKWKWGEGVQLPFNVYYFPQDPKDENWDLFGNCDEFDMGGKWYGSTLKEALRDLRTDWPEIKRRHKLLVDRKMQHLAKREQDPNPRG